MSSWRDSSIPVQSNWRDDSILVGSGEKPGTGDALPPDAFQDKLDHYWKAGMGPIPAAPTAGDAQAALEQYGNRALMGHLPQAQAKLEHLVDPESDEVADRDQNIARLAQQEKESPRASRAGSVAGLGANALLTSKLIGATGLMGNAPGLGTSAGEAIAGPATQNAYRLKRYMDAAKVAGVMGGLSNPGDVEGESDPLQLGARAKNAAMSIPYGLGGQLVADGVSLAPATVSRLKALANEKAFNVYGAGKRAFKEAFSKDQVQSLGRMGLDEGFISPIQTAKGLATKVEAAKDASGGEIGNILDQVDASNAQKAAAQEEALRASGGAQPIPAESKAPSPAELTALKRDFGLNTTFDSEQGAPLDPESIQSASDKLRGKFGGAARDRAPLPPGEVQAEGGTPADLQAFLEKFAGGKKTPPGKIDTAALADDLRGGSEAGFLSKTPGMEGASGSYNRALDTLQKNGDIDLRQAQGLRQGVDKSINFGKRVPEMTGTQQGLYEIRDALRNKMNDVVNESPEIAASGKKDALLAANKRYSALAEIDKILDDKIARDAANRSVGLTDHISGGAGATIGASVAGLPGAAVGGLAGGAVSKFGRTFGDSLRATGYDAVANALAKLPPGVSQAAESNPAAIQALISNIMGPQGSDAASPQGQSIQDRKLSDSKKKLNRSPSKTALRLKALED